MKIFLIAEWRKYFQILFAMPWEQIMNAEHKADWSSPHQDSS